MGLLEIIKYMSYMPYGPTYMPYGPKENYMPYGPTQ